MCVESAQHILNGCAEPVHFARLDLQQGCVWIERH